MVRELMGRQSQSEEQLRTLHDQNQILSQTTVSQISALMEAMERSTSQQAAAGSRTFVDARGLGRPGSFADTEVDWLSRRRKFQNFVSVGADVALDRAMEQPTHLTACDIECAFGSNVDFNDQIEGIGAINSEVFSLLMQPTTGESFDIVVNTTRGLGLEARRRFADRCEPRVGEGSTPELAQDNHSAGPSLARPSDRSARAGGGKFDAMEGSGKWQVRGTRWEMTPHPRLWRH